MAVADIFVILVLAIFGIGLIALMQRWSDPARPQQTDVPQPLVLLYENGALQDATPAAAALFGSPPSRLADLERQLRLQLPDLDLATFPEGPSTLASDPPSQWHLEIDRSGGSLRITFVGAAATAFGQASPAIAMLQGIAAHAPQLIWREDEKGRIIWANDAYVAITTEGGKAGLALFDCPPEDMAGKTTRVQLQGTGHKWFDVTVTCTDNHRLCFAIETTALVRADEDRRDFVKTLGKTFADLSTGLAIFDKNRCLTMFNPALLEMTKLPFVFLSGKPRIDTVLDRLRELQMMPEPKDYATWREQFTAVEAGAKKGTYCENWPLADGQTFRVTGRPHPDGAFALLFQDISGEISLTRRFRTEIETGQAVLDSLPDAIAVFSRAGTLVMSNAAYENLWSTTAAPAMSVRECAGEIALWRDHCVASPVWAQMRDFIQHTGPRQPWSEDAMLADGRHLRCHAIPIAGGMSLTRFAVVPPVRPVIRKLTQADPAILARKG